MKIGIIGAGHAGVAAAQSAAKENAEVTLFSDENSLPYFRPRIPAVAFGQTTAEEALMHPEKWYPENNIDLHISTSIKELRPDCTLITDNNKTFNFDKIILSSGARPIIPPFAKDIRSERVIPLWSLDNAQTISKNINSIKNLLIIGGGVIGLEAALRATDAGLNVTIIERAPILMQKQFSRKASGLLTAYLNRRNIKVITGESVEKISKIDTDFKIQTDKSPNIRADLIVLSIGAATDCAIAQKPGICTSHGIVTNEKLQSSIENIFAAGDIAELHNSRKISSAIRAAKQGKIAGFNSTKDISDSLSFSETPITLQVKYKDFSLYSLGNPPEENDEKILDLSEENFTYRGLNIKDNIVSGVQMIGTNQDFKQYEKLFITGGEYNE